MRHVLLGAIVLGLAVTTGVWADDAIAASPVKKKAVAVTARKRKTRKRKTAKAAAPPAEKAAPVAKTVDPRDGRDGISAVKVETPIAAAPPAPALALVAPPPPPPPAIVRPPPPKPPIVVDGQYRLRFLRNERDRNPRLTPSSVDSSINHRLRLGMVAPIADDLILLGGFSTQAARFGDFDVPNLRQSKRDFDFERLLMIWKYAPGETLYAGRGASAYFEADLAVATGRFNEDDIYYEGIVWEKKPDPESMLLVVYSPLVTTNLLDPIPAEFSVQSLAVNYRRDLTPKDRILFHTGRLQPRRPILGVFGGKGLTGAMARYDHKFSKQTTAFGSIGFNLSQTDGVFFTHLPDVDLDRRTAFFGGVISGDRKVLHKNVWEAYYTWTAPQAQTIFAEYPSDIREARIQWQRQVRPNVWVLASAVERELVHPAPAVEDRSNTEYLQLLAQF